MIDFKHTDSDGDALRVRAAFRADTGHAAYIETVDGDDDESAIVRLSPAEALDLYHWLGQFLVGANHIDAAAHPVHDVPTCCTGEDTSTCCPGPMQGYAVPGVFVDEAESVAVEAHDAVYGDRQADYGHPREDFTRTAILWTGLLNHKLADGAYITPEDMARCMIAVKLSRDVHAPKRDNRVDMAGYAITLDRLETGR